MSIYRWECQDCPQQGKDQINYVMADAYGRLHQRSTTIPVSPFGHKTKVFKILEDGNKEEVPHTQHV